MSLETVSLTILIGSFLGLLFFIFRKIPVLVSLPEGAATNSVQGFLPWFKNKVKNIPGFKSFSFELVLQKIISQIRVLSLKTDTKTFHWLQKLREKNRKKKLENDNYWEEVKNSADDSKK